MLWVLLATGWRRWRSALVLVQPETVVRWHRTWLRRRWAQRSGRNRAGRPPLDPHVARLVIDMAGANPLWGDPRIHGELRKLGIAITDTAGGTIVHAYDALDRVTSETTSRGTVTYAYDIVGRR